LTVEGVHAFDDRGIEKVRDVSFEVRAGEIVGIAGIDGNGQTELIDALSGLRAVAAGAVRLNGTDLTHLSALAHYHEGLGHIPEDRQRRGLVLEFTIAENIALHDYRSPPDSHFGWLFPRRLVERAARLIKEFDVRGGGAQTRSGGLSGGNQQKLVLAREIDRDPQVLIAAQPTRGLDVGAIEFVHRRLIAERDEGRGILLVSLELEEILALSDRILVIYEGQIVGELGPTATEEQLGILMTGGGRSREVAA
jgi:simple sugar transport system ATP-binding protein